MQAALGLSQLSRLDEFINKRKYNFQFLKDCLSGVEGIHFAEATPGSDPSWFGFPITLDPNLSYGAGS